MKIALINLSNGHYPPLGLMQLAGFLRKNGLDATMINDGDCYSCYDVIGISSVTQTWNRAVKIAQDALKSKMVVIGGVHPSVTDDAVDGCTIIKGEGETAMLKLLTGKSMELNLDDVPPPDYRTVARHYMYHKFYGNRAVRQVAIQSGRGCPYSCPYCASGAFWKHSVKLHSPQYVADAVKWYIHTHGINHVEFIDDLFVTPGRTGELRKAFGEANVIGKVSFSVQTRADSITDEVCRDLKAIGCTSAVVGTETMSPRMLAKLKCGTTTIEQNRSALQKLVSFGIRPTANFMFGCPGETLEDANVNLDFMRAHKHEMGFGVGVATPFPGTVWWKIAERLGTLPNSYDHVAFTGVPRLLTHMTKDEFSNILNVAKSLAAPKIPFSWSAMAAVARHPIYYARKLILQTTAHAAREM